MTKDNFVSDVVDRATFGSSGYEYVIAMVHEALFGGDVAIIALVFLYWHLLVVKIACSLLLLVSWGL